MTPGENAPDAPIHRLLDIEVEEVSLVDRAANKHRFLIVKRSDPMDEMTTEDETFDLNAETEKAEGDPAAGWDDEPDRQRDPVLAVAVEALRALTDAVETLSAVDDAGASRLAELAAELRGVASHLDALTGGDQTTRSRGDAPANGDLSALLGSLQDTLAQAKCLVDRRPGGATRADGATQTAPSTATPDPSAALAKQLAPSLSRPLSRLRGEDPSAALAKQLAPLVDAINGIAGTVTAQQRRLARLETSFGLPNSRPPGERTTRHDRDDTGWPLDLNQPLDRDSVDKTVSFHDV